MHKEALVAVRSNCTCDNPVVVVVVVVVVVDVVVVVFIYTLLCSKMVPVTWYSPEVSSVVS